MIEPIVLTPQLTRKVSHYKKYDIEVPKALLEKHAQKPDLRDFPYPLPQKKSDYTCFCEGNNGVMWYGSSSGVTRYDPHAENESDIIMYFSAKRDLPDNEIKALEPDGDGVWALTATGATHIEMVRMTMEEKAAALLYETLHYVDRHGMVSQRHLTESGNVKSVLPYGHSDNSGSFTSGFAIGEIFHYATLKKEKGEYDPETVKALEVATRASEATLLLMYISGRGNGFVARTYLTANEPVPDDGLFYKKNGATAVCLNTTEAQKKKLVGFEVKADAPIPERLRKLYTSEGFDDTDITYKGDTSSDEITMHYLHLLVAHEILGPVDPQLDELLVIAARNTMRYIIDGGRVLRECNGEPTTWAKWDLGYFNTQMGWPDACLNAAQLIMYLKVTMRLTGEIGIWQEEIDKLEKDGYFDFIPKHHDRFIQLAFACNSENRAEIMYGDHMLSVAAFWALCSLEEDPEKLEIFRKGFRSWRSSLAPEFNPGYDFLYFLSDPENAKPDAERIKTWFYRFGISRLASPVSLELRKDIPKKYLAGGYCETSALLPNDERFIAKYDRNPLEYKKEDSGGSFCVESCYPYTFAYWIGRYFGFIREG